MPRVLAYALPRSDRDRPEAVIRELDEFDLHDVPLGHSDSFLDFDAVIVFAGAFERISADEFDGYEPPVVRFATSDLDRREREFYTLLERGKPFVFLISPIPHEVGFHKLETHTDLFRRVMSRLPLEWSLMNEAAPNVRAAITEFRPFMEKHGSARVAFAPSYKYKGEATIIAGSERAFAGFTLGQKLFFLPCHHPQNHAQALDMAITAIRCVLAYRDRISSEMPEWAAEFRFAREQQLRNEVGQHREAVTKLYGELDTYTKWKGALCFKSDPLVDVVTDLLRAVYGLEIKADEQKIEDACIVDDAGNTLAVIEIKGDKGSFKRADVGQVDAHRERLGLPATTPGLLIMNTIVKATSLEEKDDQPHPDIIAKAISDNVLLIRTLDLLRYADLIEQNKLTQDDFRKHVLGAAGWLKVEEGSVEIVRPEAGAGSPGD